MLTCIFLAQPHKKVKIIFTYSICELNGGIFFISKYQLNSIYLASCQCIGATTLDEYRKHIEKDPALERRFQPVKVPEPTVDETIQILKGLRERYEIHHKLRYTDEALEAAAQLSYQYIRYLIYILFIFLALGCRCIATLKKCVLLTEFVCTHKVQLSL